MAPIQREKEVKDTSGEGDGGSFLERPESEQQEDERIGVTHNSIFFSTAPNSPTQYSSLSGLCRAFNGGFMLSLIIHSKIGAPHANEAKPTDRLLKYCNLSAFR